MCCAEERREDTDLLGALILEVLPYVEADRAAKIYHGPVEQWLDALAVCWAREQLAAQAALAW